MKRIFMLLIALAGLPFQACLAATPLFKPVDTRTQDVAKSIHLDEHLLGRIVVGSPTEVRVSHARLSGLKSLNLPLPGGLSLDASVDAHDKALSGIDLWSGHVTNPKGTVASVAGPANSVLVASDGKHIYGKIVQGRRTFILEPVSGDRHVLYEIDSSKILASADRADDAIPVEITEPSHVAHVPVGTVADPIRLRVMVAFTAEAWAREINPELSVAAWIFEVNQGLVYSNVRFRYQLVHVVRTDAKENPDDRQMLNDVTNGAGPFADIERLRREHRAHLVSLIVDKTSACGVAWQNAYYARAHSVVVNDCARASLTMAHELGHNLSADHGSDNNGSLHPYSHGYGIDGDAHTIMGSSVPCPNGCSRVNLWSSPALRFPSGRPAGNAATNDNVRSINEYSSIILTFFPRN